MPTGYAGEGKRYSRKLGRWLKAERTRTFDYDAVDRESACFLVSFFRWYPDYLADLLRSPAARYRLELPQRIMMRVIARYRNVYITGPRGVTKTYVIILSKMIEGLLFPGELMRYVAPAQVQAAKLAAQAYRQIEKDYPLLAGMWHRLNDREAMFRIGTDYGSEFTMYAPRGDNCMQVVAEEAAQEGKDGFDMQKFEADILPTVRMERFLNRRRDPVHINLKNNFISNASTRQNRAYTKYRHEALRDMLRGGPYEGYALDMSWVTSLIGGIRSIGYIRNMRASLSADNWLREMCGRYVGSSDNPMLSDEILSRSKRLMVMEDRHCGDPNAIYIVAHDVSYEEGQKNARCADVVWKLTRYESAVKRDKYRKQAVWVDSYPPPPTEAIQASALRALWYRYCLTGGQTTYLVVDARSVGKTVVQELMKPAGDGVPNLCCYRHMAYTDIEQPGALPVIYPVKASTRGGVDEDGFMIDYARREWEQGNVELLTANIADGVEAYRLAHGVRDDFQDARIAAPYRQTEGLCQEIQNLRTEVSGVSLKERRKSAAIQRDRWSAAKYGLRMAALLEETLVRETYRARSSWSEVIGALEQGGAPLPPSPAQTGERSRLLSLRKRL